LTGAGYYQRWIHQGRRISAATAFLTPAKATGRLEVKTHAHVTKILFEGKRAVGVEFQRERGGPVQRVTVRRELVLSAGAGNTPKILQLSGVGPADFLQQMGVRVVHAMEGVGENFQDHYMVRTILRVKGVTTINHTARGARLVGEIIKWAFGKPSVLAISPSVAYAFTKSRPDVALDDLQFHFSPGSYASGVAGKLDDFPGMTLGYYQLRPTSVGNVRLRSLDPFELPAVQPNYLQSEQDAFCTARPSRNTSSAMNSHHPVRRPTTSYSTAHASAVRPAGTLLVAAAWARWSMLSCASMVWMVCAWWMPR
jgi:choline dehydrogenase